MKPGIDAQLSEEEMDLLEQEIAELEKTTRMTGIRSVRVLGMGCLSALLLTISALGILLLPRPIQTGYFLLLITIGLIGIVLVFRLSSKKVKGNLAKDNEQLKGMVAQLNEKRERLKRSKQAK